MGRLTQAVEIERLREELGRPSTGQTELNIPVRTAVQEGEKTSVDLPEYLPGPTDAIQLTDQTENGHLRPPTNPTISKAPNGDTNIPHVQTSPSWLYSFFSFSEYVPNSNNSSSNGTIPLTSSVLKV